MRFVRQALAPRAGFMLAAMLAACSTGVDLPDAGTGPTACTGVLDCPTGQGCLDGFCAELPCGGRCTLSEMCVDDACVATDGLDCSDDPGLCPTGFQCTAGECQRECVTDDDCTADGYGSCNVELGLCGQCTFDSDCPSEAPTCDTTVSRCVGCVENDDCRIDNQAAGLYCDTATQTCVAGCNGDTDCPSTQRCSGGTATTPGRCVECAPISEVNDCAPFAPRVRCEPSTQLCVQCLSNADCTTGQCDTNSNTCVQCVTNEACDKGSTCDLDVFQCFLGCNGPVGGDNCPDVNPRKPVCDGSIGERGTCVECLRDADCPWGKVCKESGGLPVCVDGCNDPAGNPNDARCAASAPEDRLRCDKTQGAYGECVACLNDGHCPATEKCDEELRICRCKKEGEACGSTSECGYREDSATCATTTSWCLTHVRCDGDKRSISPICGVAPKNGGTPGSGDPKGCPSGFVTDWGCDASGDCRHQCVPAAIRCQ